MSWISTIILLVFGGSVAIMGIGLVLLLETLMGPDVDDE